MQFLWTFESVPTSAHTHHTSSCLSEPDIARPTTLPHLSSVLSHYTTLSQQHTPPTKLHHNNRYPPPWQNVIEMVISILTSRFRAYAIRSHLRKFLVTWPKFPPTSRKSYRPFKWPDALARWPFRRHQSCAKARNVWKLWIIQQTTSFQVYILFIVHNICSVALNTHIIDLNLFLNPLIWLYSDSALPLSDSMHTEA